MGFFGKVTRFVRRVLATINIVVILVMCACGYAGAFSPAAHPWTELLVLAFPVPFTLNILFFLVWLVVSPRYVLLPIIGLLLCWTPCRRYCPINKEGEPDDKCIKVMTFNVAAFNLCEKNTKRLNGVVEYLVDNPADITCLQESHLHNYHLGKFTDLLHPIYPYIYRANPQKGETLTFLSKYPILDSEQIKYKTTRNTSWACRMLVDGDTILVVNSHMESTLLKQEDREEISDILKKREINTKERTILDKLCMAAVRRAPQVDSLASYLERHRGMTTILCGDFNDTPNSYAYDRMAKYLDNAFEHTGTGMGHTYKNYHMNVRIDNIFLSPDLEAVKCKIDDKTHVSDHFPVICWLKKRPKP